MYVQTQCYAYSFIYGANSFDACVTASDQLILNPQFLPPYLAACAQITDFESETSRSFGSLAGGSFDTMRVPETEMILQ
jgi:hypothetical protein